MDYVGIYNSTQILEVNYWNKYKHLIMKELDQTDIKLLDEFYYNATQMECARKELADDLAKNWSYKAQALQNERLKLFKDNPKDVSYFKNFYEDKFTFMPNVPAQKLSKYLNLYKPIISSATYKDLIKYSYLKKRFFRKFSI